MNGFVNTIAKQPKTVEQMLVGKLMGKIARTHFSIIHVKIVRVVAMRPHIIPLSYHNTLNHNCLAPPRITNIPNLKNEMRKKEEERIASYTKRNDQNFIQQIIIQHDMTSCIQRNQSHARINKRKHTHIQSHTTQTLANASISHTEKEHKNR